MTGAAPLVLVVEDELPVRRFLRAALAGHGYRVEEAGAVAELTHRQILREVWGPNATEAHYVRVQVAELRKKLEADPARPRLLITEPGVGYRLRARVE